MSYAVIESSADRRRHARDEASARELVTTLERQARAIVEAAAAAEQDDTVHAFAQYRIFRAKVGEFESLCAVIETNLRKIAVEPRGVLKELFQTRRDMVLGPSIRAMTSFYTRLSDGAVLPLGLFDILESELQALGGMREALAAAEPRISEDAETRGQIDTLEGIIRGLKDRATQFEDFSEPSVVAAGLPPEEAPSEDAAANAADEPVPGDTPELRAVRTIRELLEPRRTDYTLGQHAEIDLRALDDIERRLATNPGDESAAKWLRHICNAWGSRMRNKEHVFLRIAREIR